ncbi:MAG: leucine-rich repeat domain-containing protein [Paludibacteraceae bacterium]|nr:leucine-rich repeat domain-containing protein [Paludibacteraceae bacterium]
MKSKFFILLVAIITAPILWATDSIPNNQIWYTSTDGQIVSPNSGGGARFNVNIVSNTYENGQGIITFDGDLVWIGQSAFYSTNLTTVILPNSLKTLNTTCFLECMDLQSVTLPMGIDTTIGQGAFATCSSLTSISILRNAAIDSINTKYYQSPYLGYGR